MAAKSATTEYISLLDRVSDLSPEAVRAVKKVEKAGFYWQLYATQDHTECLASIRLKLDRWSCFDTEAASLSEAVLGAYSKIIELLPGIEGLTVEG